MNGHIQFRPLIAKCAKISGETKDKLVTKLYLFRHLA